MDMVYNWHITEHCNYSCHYCFAKWDSPPEIWKDEQKVHRILEELKHFGHTPFSKKHHGENIRLNIAGGEPMLLGEKLIDIVSHAKEMGFLTSIITNASLVDRYISIAKHLDMIGISIDSLSHTTNLLIGRCSKSRHSISYYELSSLISKLRRVNPEIHIKFNVVVNTLNYNEVFLEKLESLKPGKIKILKELSAGQNRSQTTDAMFKHFIANNKVNTPLFIENNNAMLESYLMIDPLGRIYQNSLDGKYTYSKPIDEVGLREALSSTTFNIVKFMERYNEQ